MQSIYLIRHAKATGQEPYAELTEEGLNQAEKLANMLAKHSITYVISSPWKRAVQTALPLGSALLQHIHTDERLEERVLSSRDLPNWMDVLKRTYDDVDWVEEGGESSRMATARVVALMEDLWDRPEQHGAVFTHGNLLSLIIREYEPSHGYDEWAKLSNPDVYILERQQEDGDKDGDVITVRRIWED